MTTEWIMILTTFDKEVKREHMAVDAEVFEGTDEEVRDLWQDLVNNCVNRETARTIITFNETLIVLAKATNCLYVYHWNDGNVKVTAWGERP